VEGADLAGRSLGIAGLAGKLVGAPLGGGLGGIVEGPREDHLVAGAADAAEGAVGVHEV